MNTTESISTMYQFLSDIRNTYGVMCQRLGVVERCEIVSELPPDQWPEEVIWPYPVSLRGYPFFGRHHVAMERTKSISLIDALIWTELVSSNGEARKSIRNNAAMINRVKCMDITRVLTPQDRLANLDAIVVENGKHNIGIIEMC